MDGENDDAVDQHSQHILIVDEIWFMKKKIWNGICVLNLMAKICRLLRHVVNAARELNAYVVSCLSTNDFTMAVNDSRSVTVRRDTKWK